MGAARRVFGGSSSAPPPPPPPPPPPRESEEEAQKRADREAFARKAKSRRRSLGIAVRTRSLLSEAQDNPGQSGLK